MNSVTSIITPQNNEYTHGSQYIDKSINQSINQLMNQNWFWKIPPTLLSTQNDPPPFEN